MRKKKEGKLKWGGTPAQETTGLGKQPSKERLHMTFLQADLRASHSQALWGEQTSRHVMLTLLHALQNLIHYLRDSRNDISCLDAFLFLKILLLFFKVFLSYSRMSVSILSKLHTIQNLCKWTSQAPCLTGLHVALSIPVHELQIALSNALKCAHLHENVSWVSL